MKSDAAQPPNLLVSVVVDVHPVVVALRRRVCSAIRASGPDVLLLLGLVPLHYAVFMEQLFTTWCFFLLRANICANCAFLIFDNLQKERKNGQSVSLVCDYEENGKKASSAIYELTTWCLGVIYFFLVANL